MVTYPFFPKTTARIQVGDFWSITLDDGRYSAGRVLQVLNRATVLGCVLNWSSDTPPTVASIDGAGILNAGELNIRKTVEDCGDGILGNRSLELDEIIIPLFRSHEHGLDQRLLRGAVEISPVSANDRALPVLTTWGYGVARLIANSRFCSTASTLNPT
jgi:hypothetical protein